jgi:hypothetical protein
MRRSCPPNYGWRLLLAALLSGLGLTMWLFLGGRPAPSWAAPAQNPDMQTVPTRRPPATSEPEPKEQPTGNTVGVEPTGPPYTEQDTPVLTLTETPASTLAAPAESPAPSETTLATIESGEDASLSSSPLPSSSTTPRATPTKKVDRPLPPPTPTSTPDGLSGQPSASVSYRASPPLWLYAIGLGLLFILGGLFLIKRW